MNLIIHPQTRKTYEKFVPVIPTEVGDSKYELPKLPELSWLEQVLIDDECFVVPELPHDLSGNVVEEAGWREFGIEAFYTIQLKLNGTSTIWC